MDFIVTIFSWNPQSCIAITAEFELSANKTKDVKIFFSRVAAKSDSSQVILLSRKRHEKVTILKSHKSMEFVLSGRRGGVISR